MYIINLFSILSGLIFLAGATHLSIAISKEEMGKHSHWFVFAFSAFGTLLFIVGVVTFPDSENPTALDVYQGKTTLEITYRDSVAVDSVVVFKNKEK